MAKRSAMSREGMGMSSSSSLIAKRRRFDRRSRKRGRIHEETGYLRRLDGPPPKRRRIDHTLIRNPNPSIHHHLELAEKKLILVLDLDRTLIHSADIESLSPHESQLLLNSPDLVIIEKQDDRIRTENTLFAWNPVPSEPTITKLRPFVRAFLREACRLFDLYVYTLGSRSYARGIVQILDPDRVYFDPSKVISRDESTLSYKKSLNLVSRDDRAVVILDDREDVWEDHPDNLIHINGDVHQLFFYDDCPDVRVMLRIMRGLILEGCKIVFTDPVGVTNNKPIWKMAQQCGATCSLELDAAVTHVVSWTHQPEPARWAMENNKFLVNPLWVESAYYAWRRPKEADFLID